ncbi:MAG TPA: DUF814 domain-containing protein [Candidatus Altiarchaeales archaeon]|nr:DUF814 domain-containing protein [Candidatus Altiarchaeales archaeon]HEX54756.1 DUF814 domain-containing protein [Candidatus Altiarchaeales archaeon]
MEIKLDIRKSSAENANLYYERAKKIKKKIMGAKRIIEETRERIRKLESEKKSVRECKEMVKRSKEKRKWYEKFRYFRSSDNFLVVGGKDSKQNEILIKKYLDKNDLVFHANVHGAPFFVIKNPNNDEIPESTLREAAEASASYSRAWRFGIGSCDVYYVKPEQVSKRAPSGEYVPKGGFMIYGRRNWFRNIPLKIGIGFRINENVEVIGGPVSAIEKNSRYFVVIGVGDKKSGKLAREIKERIMKIASKEDSEKIKGIEIDEIQRFIPAGRGRILRE